MDDPQTSSYEAAVARFLDGELEPSDAELIAEVLRQEPQRFREISGLAAVDDLLRQHNDVSDSAFLEGLVERLKAQASGARFVHDVERRLKIGNARPYAARSWMPWSLAATACVVAAIAWWRPSPRSPAPTPTVLASQPASRPSEPLALMVNQSQAKFADGLGPDVVSFGRGEYSLLQGAAHLRFRNGTDMVVLAPSRIFIEDALHVRLHEGALRALVPTSAHGFMVAAPGVQFKDLGTEFGVKVKPNGGSELHVFDGQVEVFSKGNNKPEKTVLGGQSIAVNDDKLQPGGAAREQDFPSANSISLLRWNAWRGEFRNDPNLVMFLPFVEDPTNPRLLNDEAVQGAHIKGLIEGAEWVTGRWPGKKALQFERVNDAVSLEIPGQYDQITLAAWLKVDRVENTEHSILSSVGWQPGGLQWQFNRRRHVESTAIYSDPKRRVLETTATLPIGQWVHWAVTVDRQTGRMLHYVNGKLAAEAQIAPGSLIKPGPCTIGHWIDDSVIPQMREFRGRIDEMAMWRVLLPQSRIEALADSGMPVELPEPPAAKAR